jgi:hypothetical protein
MVGINTLDDGNLHMLASANPLALPTNHSISGVTVVLLTEEGKAKGVE